MKPKECTNCSGIIDDPNWWGELCRVCQAKPTEDLAIDTETNKALAEIGPIEPWWSEEDGMYVFEHPAYPMVMHADSNITETMKGYIRALRGFIQERMEGNVAESVERITSGRGGARPGAGRKPGSTKEPTRVVRLPVEVADWLQEDPSHLAEVRKLILN